MNGFNINLVIGGAAFLACVQLIQLSAHAQPVLRPSAWISGDYSSHSEFKDPPISALDNASVQTAVFSGGFSVPVVLHEGRVIFILDASYKQRQYRLGEWPTGVSREPNNVHDVGLGLTLQRMLSPKWAWALHVSPGLASDFGGMRLVGDDITLQIATVFTRFLNNRWTLGFGLAYVSTLGTPLPLPVFTFDWDNENRWYARGSLPEHLSLWYRSTATVEFGLQMDIEGNQYHTPGVFPANEPRLQYINARFGPSARIHLNKSLTWILDGFTGVSLQFLRLYDGNNEVENANYDLKAAPYIRTRIQYTF